MRDLVRLFVCLYPPIELAEEERSRCCIALVAQLLLRSHHVRATCFFLRIFVLCVQRI